MLAMKKIRILEGIRQGKIGGGESYLLGLVENMDRELCPRVKDGETVQ